MHDGCADIDVSLDIGRSASQCECSKVHSEAKPQSDAQKCFGNLAKVVH